MKKYLLIIEIDQSKFNINQYNNYIDTIKNYNYNFVYCVLSKEKVYIPSADMSYVIDSKYAFIYLIKDLKLNYDYIVHIRYINLINFRYIVNYNYDDFTIYASNDRFYSVCRVFHKKTLKKIN